jgi:hypothetical protein
MRGCAELQEGHDDYFKDEDEADGPLGDVVGHLQASVLGEAGERVPAGGAISCPVSGPLRRKRGWRISGSSPPLGRYDELEILTPEVAV